MLTAERKQQLILENARHEGDTSPKVGLLPILAIPKYSLSPTLILTA